MVEDRLVTQKSWWNYFLANGDEFSNLRWKYVDDKYCTIGPLTDEQYLRWCILYE